MKKSFLLILALGILLLAATVYLFMQQWSFVNNSQQTVASVIDYHSSFSSSTKGENKRYYYPILTFTDQTGQTVTFKSNVGTVEPSYQIGEHIEILYNPAEPDNAAVNNFMAIWGGVIALGLFGIILFGAGIIFFWLSRRKNKLKRDMVNNGRCVTATIESVKIDKSVKVNGRYPYVIMCYWTDRLAPDTVYRFKSDNIWCNPEPYINKETIPVFIDENNPHRYYVDIGFLSNIK
ncbi:uncharacterized protein DUF3592 [Orbus hercynius]|uniref:Uncharacterized protein DUF3592 n=1 Tax=Orbus hercynius TaxID=593135 RepID=A0A495RJH0_9GAMM|nr:DUF3592 domain-containing protein [Orbus hercynius]RKS87595.1 uncharacterized protein DUF3592 [Orbus hercynius]